MIPRKLKLLRQMGWWVGLLEREHGREHEIVNSESHIMGFEMG